MEHRIEHRSFITLPDEGVPIERCLKLSCDLQAMAMDAISVLLSFKASNPYVSIGTVVVAIKCRATKEFL